MLVQGKRPRELHWYHAGPMLFGDWGTSRLYVLGLAFSYMHHSALWFMGAMGLLLVAVGWAYQVICRMFPDGGGVYSAARQRSHTLGVIGALLLCADYVVTAAISALDAFHYVHLPQPHWWAAAAIGAVGVLNFFGPRKAGTVALVVAVLTMLLTACIAMIAAPSLSQAQITRPEGSIGQWWTQFTAIILAISGVEAIANMTGIMVDPVPRTSRRAIWPVLIEIVLLNIILTVAMQAMPLEVLGDGDPNAAFSAHRDNMLHVLAEHYVGPAFAAVASLVFGLLLLSAVNTAVTDLVSIQFMMARDRELPPLFAALNQFGMPLVPLVIGTLVPLVTVLAVPDVGKLADLYAIGVVGAIAVNLAACSTNWKLTMRPWERYGMIALAVFMVAVWITIAYEKPNALAFALGIMAAGLAGRWAAHNQARIREWMLEPVPYPMVVPSAERTTAVARVPAPAPPLAVPQAPIVSPESTRSRVRAPIMVATRGNPKLFEFALQEAQSRRADLFVLFIRHIAIPAIGPSDTWSVAQDDEAQTLFAQVRPQAEAAGVTIHFLYAVAHDLADTILDLAVTHGVDTLILGATQRGTLWRTMKGDVIQRVAQYLPENIRLLIHA